MDIVDYNKKAWNQAVQEKDRWTVPVSSEAIEQARQGKPELVLTPLKPVPLDWLLPVKGQDILCLASGGGQQGPLLAAAGGHVVVFDNSPLQLEQDQLVAKKEGLALKTLQGDMKDLKAFSAESFDLIIHPVSNCFVDDVLPVWREAYRVLKAGGRLLSGFANPLLFSYDRKLEDKEILQIKYPVPFSALTSLNEDELKKEFINSNQPLEFGHSLSDQIGGQIQAGFIINGFYEDQWGNRFHDRYMPHFIATRAVKPE